MKRMAVFGSMGTILYGGFVHYENINAWLSYKYSRHHLKLRNADTGIWLVPLLPFTLFLAALAYPKSSITYKICACVSVNFLVSAYYNIRYEPMNLHQQLLSRLPYTMFYTLLVDIFTTCMLSIQDSSHFGYILIMSIIMHTAYHIMIYILISEFPFSFTYGEASVVVQSIILFGVAYIYNIYSYWIYETISNATTIYDYTNGILGNVLMAALMGVSLLRLYSSINSYCFIPLSIIYVSFLTYNAKCTCIQIFIIMNEGAIDLDAIMNFFHGHARSVFLLVGWACMIILAFLFAFVQVKYSNESTSISRKFFHICLLAVYVTGLMYNVWLLYLCSGFVLIAFLVMEIIRLSSFPGSEVLERLVVFFKDYQDSGPLALTPIYLFAGVSFPLLLFPVQLKEFGPFSSSVFAGFLSIGIGDTAAAFFGTMYGHRKWHNSCKSIEGSIFCFLWQTIALYVLYHSKLVVFNVWELIWVECSIAFVTILEAKTAQIDNLALPLVAFLLLIMGEGVFKGISR